MKKTDISKLLSLSLAALICFTGCKPKPSSSETPVSSQAPVSSQTPASSETPASSQAPSSSETTPSGNTYVLNFSGLTGTGSKIDSDPLTTVKSALGSNSSALTAASYENIYDGNGDGGAHPNSSGFLKFGKSKTDGSLTLAFEGLSFTTCESVCHDWYTSSAEFPTNTNKVSVNGSAEQLAPYNTTGTGEKLTFTFSATDTITIVSNDRVFVWTITLY